MLFAHTDHSDGISRWESFGEGFLHPLLGYDHLIVMVAIGVLSIRLGREFVLPIPLAFVVGLVLGGVLGLMEVTISNVEVLIQFSILLLLGLIVYGRRLQPEVALVFAAVAGLIHGNPHGLEIPHTAGPFAYVLGFSIASTLAHVGGLLIGEAARRIVVPHRAATVESR